MTLNAFHWRAEIKATALASPQLSYYHRKMALGIHPRQLRREGKEVIDQRFKKNRNENT